jgi:AcrR family transcriptional regulator
MGRPRQVSDEQILEAARRCFLTHGVHLPVQAIAEEIGVSHAAIFSRYGTKEALLIAALGPPKVLPFTAALADGPDARPIPVQLGEIGRQLVDYFERIGAGWALLQAAGIGLDKVFQGRKRPTPLDAYDQLHAWLRRARRRRLLGPCDVDVVTWTFLGALHHRVFRSAPPNEGVRRTNGEDVDRLIETLWRGIAPAACG